MALSEGIDFFVKFIRQPTSIGAVWPSSQRLARRMVEGIDWTTVDTVVEFGPGTGVFTQEVVAAMRPDARLIAIEMQADLADRLRARFPQATIAAGDVVDVQEVCQREGVAKVDAIVSGLPWAFFEAEKQAAILQASTAVLKPGGHFVTFAYLQGLLLPAGQRFRANLRRHFSDVQTSRTEWLNFPPAFVYRCRR